MTKKIWKKPTFWAVLGVIAFLLFSISKEAFAETVIEYSPVVAVSGHPQDDWGALMLHERFKDKYSVGVILLVDLEDRANSNRGIEVLRYSKYKRAEVGIGFTAWAHDSLAWSGKQTFTLMLGYNITPKITVRLRHWSTGGSSTRNAGLDMLTASYMFGKK